MWAGSFDQIAVLAGTDKSSLEHDYARQYERAFEPFRAKPIDVVEIGVADGASLNAWEQFFTQARLIGVDIIPGCARHTGGRKVVEIGSQSDPSFLSTIVSKYLPTIIIDDGSHVSDDIEATFRHLFPHLQPGGCYVIEDLYFHVKPATPAEPAGALRYLLDIAVATVHASPGWAPRDEFSHYLVEHIDRIEFVKRAAFIWKKALPLDSAQKIRAMRDVIERSSSPRNWRFFVHYILANGGSLEEAEAAAREAIARGDKSGLAHWRLSETLERQDKIAAALAAAREALVLSQGIPAIRERVDRLNALLD